jgi:hypothetical protein
MAPSSTRALRSAAAEVPTHRDDRAAAAAWRRAWWLPVLAYVLVCGASFVLVTWSLDHWSLFDLPPPNQPFPDQPWLDGWVRWDAGWYRLIATDGYPFYDPAAQSPVAFFPAYPLLMAIFGEVLDVHVYIAGIAITVVAGLGAVVLFHRWCLRHVGPTAALTALVLLVVYPYSYYVFGAVYADALFLVAILGAFLLAERDHPVLAGLVGAVATGARPVGGAVIVGLVILVCAKRGVVRPAADVAPAGAGGPTGRLARLRARIDLGRLRPGDAGVLLSAAGLVAYCTFLWLRFDAPLAFMQQTGAPGWEQSPGFETWFKVSFYRTLRTPQSPINYARFLSQAAFTLTALALVPTVIRRFGWAYGAYALLIVAVPAFSTKDFTGMGRYLLAAFPCFAAAGLLLAESRWLRPLRVPALVASAAALAVFTSAFSRGYYLS